MKQIPGMSYVIEPNNRVVCEYLCPYCKRETIDCFFSDNPNGYPNLYNDAWFENLTCRRCGEIAKVRFFPSMRKD